MYLSHPKSPFAACRGVPSSVALQVRGAAHPCGQSRRSCKRKGPSLPSCVGKTSHSKTIRSEDSCRQSCRSCKRKGSSLPRCVGKTSDLKLGACDAWTQGGGMCFACRSGATARRAGPRGTVARGVDVRTTQQAARCLGLFFCHGGHFSGATKPKHVPPAIAYCIEHPRI